MITNYTMKYAIFIIYFLFQPFVLYGFYNQSELLVNLNYNNNDKTVITRGYWNNAINNNNTTFHLNFIVQEPEYIYNLNHDKHLFNFTTHLYAKYNLELLNTINDISIGFSPTLSSENFLNQFFNIKPIYFGYQSLTKINGNNNDNYYILSNSGLNNNSAFNLSYDISYF